MDRTLNTLNQVEADLHMYRAKGEVSFILLVLNAKTDSSTLS